MEKETEKINKASETISKLVSVMKKNEPKKEVDLVAITKKLSSKKFGKK